MRLRSLSGLVCAAAIAASASCNTPSPPALKLPAMQTQRIPHETEVVFLATPQVVVERILEVAKVTRDDVVYDLGCGDGRIVITAAKKYGARGVGVEIDARRVAEAREAAQASGVSHLVRIEQRDIFEVDLAPATVVTLYLFPDLNTRLRHQLRALRVGARVVSHDFGIDGVPPHRTESLIGPEYDGSAATKRHELLIWIAPLER